MRRSTPPREGRAISRNVIGTRIRERRRALGLTQAELARRVGISASYMNLIERNRRAIAGPLLRRTAEALSLRLDELDGAAERRLLEMLDEVAHAPELAALGVEADAAGDLIARYPGWARALAALAGAEREASAAARALADRLTHDPHLAETVHRMLTRIATIRSAAEILGDVPELAEDRRARFGSMIREESRALSDVGEGLAEYLDRAAEPRRTLTPLDEVEALFEARGNRFPAIEEAAAALSARLTVAAPPARHGQARALAEAELGQAVDAVLAEADEVETTPGLARARRALLDHAAAAILAPMPAFAPRAAALGYDFEALADAFAAGVGTICLRLTALPDDADHPRFGYFRANAAGTIVERRGLPGLVVPRHAPACPLWALYRAQAAPGTVLRQRAVFPSGGRFVLVARARTTGPAGFGQPRHYLTDMLAMSDADARETVYAPDSSAPAEEVGPACRICARRACAHRVEDPVGG